MSDSLEDKFRRWAKPPSQSEEDRCNNAVTAIRNAINGSSKLRNRNIKVFLQGSYRNNTNVRQDSDVDVGVLCLDTFFPDYPDGKGHSDFGIDPATYDYDDFKNDVGEALVAHFRDGTVTRGNKAFDIKATSYHVEADVAPFFEHRRYSVDGRYISGVQLLPDNGIPTNIINWPEQHYDNGVGKNKATRLRYKSLVRIFKKLRNEMAEQGNNTAKPAVGFLLECLMWNVPDRLMGSNLYTEDMRQALTHLYNKTKSNEECGDWGEVSELKYLFNSTQKWTRSDAHNFVLAAWNHIGF